MPAKLQDNTDIRTVHYPKQIKLFSNANFHEYKLSLGKYIRKLKSIQLDLRSREPIFRPPTLGI